MELHRLQNVVLRQMADGKDKVLAEMAREVLSGRMTMREAAFGSAYREVFATAAQRVSETVGRMNPEEIKELAAEQTIDEYLAQHEAEPPVSPPQPEDDFDTPILQGPRDAQPRRARWNRRWT